jgi:dTMP kinase
MCLFYATDFADRLENQIIPALKAGFIVLSDRYFFSVIARDIVRGANPVWVRKIYGFALVPDLILYLRANVDTLIARIVHGRGMTYWEAGMDIRCADNLYDSFVVYQSKLIEQFDVMSQEYNFITIDANRSPTAVDTDLRTQISSILLKE